MRTTMSVMVFGAMVLGAGCGAEAPTLGAQHEALTFGGSLGTITANHGKVGRIGRVIAPPSGLSASCVGGEAGAFLQISATAHANVPSKNIAVFALTDTPRLYLNALLRNVCGAHTGSFDLYAPDGSFYARLSAPFDARKGGAGVREGSEGFIVEMEFPIAGSAIPSMGLYGTWSINFAIDGNGLAIGLGQFELNAQ